jgi:hypothetical protein
MGYPEREGRPHIQETPDVIPLAGAGFPPSHQADDRLVHDAGLSHFPLRTGRSPASAASQNYGRQPADFYTGALRYDFPGIFEISPGIPKILAGNRALPGIASNDNHSYYLL